MFGCFSMLLLHEHMCNMMESGKGRFFVTLVLRIMFECLSLGLISDDCCQIFFTSFYKIELVKKYFVFHYIMCIMIVVK